MRSLICLVITGLFLGMAPVHAAQGRGNGNFKIARTATKPVSDVEIVVKSRRRATARARVLVA